MKGLQKLERIKKLSCAWDVENDEFKDAVEIVPNAFKTIEKELKALEIIKNKKLDVCSFINNFVKRNDSYETYVLYFEKPIEIDYCVISEELLTEEEFNLVKEVLL